MRTRHPEFFVEQVDRLLLVLHTRQPPPDAEWAQLAELSRPREAGAGLLPMLVLTDGGNPTSKQRALVQPTLTAEKPLTAVVSDAVAIRFVVSSITLFNENVRSFAPVAIDAAIDWLTPSLATAAETRRTLRRLAKEPGGDRFETLRRSLLTIKGA